MLRTILVLEFLGLKALIVTSRSLVEKRVYVLRIKELTRQRNLKKLMEILQKNRTSLFNLFSKQFSIFESSLKEELLRRRLQNMMMSFLPVDQIRRRQ